jgi:hypothetical protein
MPNQDATRFSPKEFSDEAQLIATTIAKVLFNDLYPTGIVEHEFQILSALNTVTANVLVQIEDMDVLPKYIAQLTQTVEAFKKGEGTFIRTRSDH